MNPDHEFIQTSQARRISIIDHSLEIHSLVGAIQQIEQGHQVEMYAGRSHQLDSGRFYSLERRPGRKE